ncbi:nitronate monooxygenase [Tsukamurella soli]|uniref:Nitronate monooxygenase n=1 Tax=Tsukamurella soli TaxID=644556 RepID=A0ABP8JRV1_9ACTN
MDLLDRLKMDVPVVQAGMGNLAPARLAAAVAGAGGLGTIGFRSLTGLREQIGRFRAEVPDRAVAVNLLMPFATREHVDAAAGERVDVAVLAFGGDAGVVERLHDAGVTVAVLVGTVEQARRALSWGADVLIAQGVESGGHLSGGVDGDVLLRQVLGVAGGTPVLRAGGIATREDVRRALQEGAAAAVAGTRFVLTDECPAHPAYKQRMLDATGTQTTTLFGLGWPCRHRVVANAATRRWCTADGRARAVPRLINSRSAPLARFAREGDDPGGFIAKQRVGLPLFSPATPIEGMPVEWVERSALYAGDSALRIDAVVSAADAVAGLAP